MPLARRLQRAAHVITGGSSPITGFISAFPGGGGQASNDVSPFDKNVYLGGTDTGGIRVSADGLTTSYLHLLGFNGTRSRQTDGVKFSRIVNGRAFMTCGDGTSGSGGGVFVAQNLHDKSTVTKWVQLDGIAGGQPQLIFDGGNNTVAAATLSGSPPYPRHYGSTIEIDETTLAGYTFIHVATVNDGAWRIKMRNSDFTAVEQVQYSGTSGKYLRCLQMACYAPNDTANNYGRIILSVYDGGTPSKPLLCTNANDTSASPTLSTSTITAAPTNVEGMTYINGSAVGSQPVTVFCTDGYVGFSTNAFSAAAGSIAITNVAAVSGAPETSERWISAGATNNGSTYYILVGTYGGAGSGSTYNTAWRGSWTGSSTTPWSAVSWTALSGSAHWSEQVLNKSGASNLWWLYGSNTPGMNGTAAISGFATSKTDPSRMYVLARGNAYLSDDYGLHWYSSNIFGSAAHSSIYWYRGAGRTGTFVTTTGDWPFAGSLDAFATQPHAILRNSYNANAVWEDPKTGECFVGGTTTGGTTVPATDNGNTVWGVSYANLSTTSLDGSILVDYNLNTGSGASTSVGGPLCGVTVYNNAGTGSTRTIITGTMGNQGLWWTNNDGTSWNQVHAATGATDPFDTQGSYMGGQMWWDQSRDLIYIMDRGNGFVWRCSVSGTGTISTATCLFGDSWAYGTSQDACGYIDIDTTNNRLWVATTNGVWYINSASTATNNTAKGNATASGFNTQYPGELVGPMCFLPYDGSVAVATLGLDGSKNQIYSPSLNGADGPRFLHVTSPTSSSSWNPSTVDDWTVSRDRGYRMGYQYPYDIARNFDGSIVSLAMQGNGVGMWKQ